MVRQRLRPIAARGFTLAELIVVVAIMGTLMALSLPFFLRYWQSATLKAGAEELATLLNVARQLAIKDNGSVCVVRESSGTRIRYEQASCGGTAWTGPGTDASGWIRLANSVEVSAATASVVFTYLGAASPGGTYTVRNPANSATMSVIVAASGRVSIQ